MHGEKILDSVQHGLLTVHNGTENFLSYIQGLSSSVDAQSKALMMTLLMMIPSMGEGQDIQGLVQSHRQEIAGLIQEGGVADVEFEEVEEMMREIQVLEAGMLDDIDKERLLDHVQEQWYMYLIGLLVLVGGLYRGKEQLEQRFRDWSIKRFSEAINNISGRFGVLGLIVLFYYIASGLVYLLSNESYEFIQEKILTKRVTGPVTVFALSAAILSFKRPKSVISFTVLFSIMSLTDWIAIEPPKIHSPGGERFLRNIGILDRDTLPVTITSSEGNQDDIENLSIIEPDVSYTYIDEAKKIRLDNILSTIGSDLIEYTNKEIYKRGSSLYLVYDSGAMYTATKSNKGWYILDADNNEVLDEKVLDNFVKWFEKIIAEMHE